MSAAEPPTDRVGARLGDPGPGLRVRTARGTLVNGAFLVGVNVLSLLRGLLVAAFLTRAEYGVWGLLLVCMATLLWFRHSGIGDKFVQQDESDQETEFQKALTMEVVLGLTVTAIGLALVPALAYAYDTPEAALPGMVLVLSLPALALQAPLYVFYRRMDFVRQRTLQAVDPVTAFVVTLPLAFAGLGYWSMVLGTVAGAWVGALVALRACPYPIRWNWDGERARRYARFSAPLLFYGGVAVVFGQVLVGVGEAEVGIAGVGAISLAATITQFANRADHVVTSTIYPAICAVQDRLDLLHETFVKSNRIALVWGAPYGLGVALFAEDLVHHVFGDEWAPAIILLQTAGIAAAVHQVGFNWDAFYRARDDTAPIAWSAGWAMAAFLGIATPLLILEGIPGLAYGLLAVEGVTLVVRGYYLRRLFPRLKLASHMVRAFVPGVPGIGAVLLLRALVEGDSLARAIAEVGLYGVITVVATTYFERALLREAAGYLRRRATVA